MKYYLSKKACEGIIRRAHNRGKVLPPLLDTALKYRIDTAESGTETKSGIAVIFDGKQVTSKQNRSNPQIGSPCHTLAVGSCDSALCVKVCKPHDAEAESAVGFDGYNGHLTGEKSSTLGINCGMSTGRNGVLDKMKSVYGLCSNSSNSMKSSNPGSGIYEAETTRTLDSQGGNPSCNQGGMIIVESAQADLGAMVILNDQGGESMSVEKSDISPTLRSETHGHLPIIAKGAMAVHESIAGDRINISDIAYALRSGRKPLLIEEISLHPDIAPTLTASAGGTSRPGGGQGSELDYYIAYALQGNMIGRADHNGPQGDGINENMCFTLNATDQPAVAFFNHTHSQAPPTPGDTASCQTARQYKKSPVDLIVHLQHFINMGMMSIKESEIANTQTARQYKGTMDYLVSINANGGHSQYTEGVFGTLARSGGEMGGGGESLVVEPFYIVRRLTPTECERLQGFPDGWTQYGANSEKEIADTPRYQMLGNSVAIPCVRFLLKNIVQSAAKESICA